MAWRINIGRILNRPRRIIRLITLAWLLIVVVGSLHVDGWLDVFGFLQSTRLLPIVSFLHSNGPPATVGPLPNVGPGPVVDLHREIHWLAFGGAAFLLLLLSRNRRQEVRGIVATCILGLSLEYLQHLIYHIHMEWIDVGDDALAAFAALTLYWLVGTCKAVFQAPPCAMEFEIVSPTEAAKS
jgi:hypothetical protein